MTSPADQHDRVIRVFISSTFRDMHQEREVLIKRIFPQLRKMCEERAVTWTEVDLRWGITAEQSAEGKVLPLCLAEIERCRPWFIGLLGERYGWVPDSISADLLESQEWLKDHLEQSVTELEILHGVLRNPAMANRSLFFFRDPGYLDRLTADADRADFTSESPSAAAKLANLKNKIREEHVAGKLQFAQRENYANPEALGEQVLADFTAIIENLYPTTQVPDPLDQEAARHEAYAQSRRLAFVGREDLLRRLDEHISTAGKPLVLTGDSGCGKSSLLAEWVYRWRKDHPDDLIIQHFIGSTPDSADCQGLLRRILSELKRAFAITDDIPLQPDALRGALNDWTVKAAGSRRVVLVLDALNQLAEDSAARQLGWLPVVFPANFRVLVSSLPGESLDALGKRDCPELNVPLFARADIAPAALAYFKIFSKTPPQDIVAKLESTPAACNALYLRAVLDELRQFGKHEQLAAKAADYLSASDPKELYERILERWEKDFGEALVRRSLSLISAARRGLSEAELLDLNGEGNNPLPRAHWSPLFLATEHSLTSRRGLLGFSHDHLRQAVQKRFLSSETDRCQAHLRLADYFGVTKLGPHDLFNATRLHARRLEELPWQLAKGNAWTLLYELLANRWFLAMMGELHRWDLSSYWAQVETHSSLRMLDAYRPLLDSDAMFAQHVANLLSNFGHTTEALQLRQHLVDVHRQSNDKRSLARTLGNFADCLQNEGRFDEALALYREQEAACKETGQAGNVLAQAIFGQARILKDRGCLEEAWDRYVELEQLSREASNVETLPLALRGQASILRTRGEWQQSQQRLRDAERFSRKREDPVTLADALIGHATVSQDQGNLTDALDGYIKAENIFRQHNHRFGLSQSLLGQAEVLRARGDFERAIQLFQKVEQVCREINNKWGVSTALHERSIILLLRGDNRGALDLLLQQEVICREMGGRNVIGNCLNVQGAALCALGQLDRAAERNQDAESIFRSLGDKRGLAACLTNRAILLRAQGNDREALAVLKEEETLCRALNDRAALSRSLGHQALIWEALGDLDAAIRLHIDGEQISRELGDKSQLYKSLGNRAVILIRRRDLDGSMRLLKEAEKICRELKDQGGLQALLANQASVFRASGKLDIATQLLKEQERICRELENVEGLAISLVNQAALLAQNMNRPREALPLAEEAYRLACECGYNTLSKKIKPLVDHIHARLG